MPHRWEYCTLVATQTDSASTLLASVLDTRGEPSFHPMQTDQLGPAIAQLGCEGWEMCGFCIIPFADGIGQQFYFKRVLQ